MHHFLSFTAQWCGMAIVAIAFVRPVAAQAPVEPLLQKYCLGCHNQNDAEGGLSLQTQDALKKGGDNGSVVDRSNLADSILLKVLTKDADSAMPPEDEPQPTDAERELLRNWVLAGAKIQSMAAGVPDVPKLSPFAKPRVPLMASVVLPKDGIIAVGGGRTIAAQELNGQKERWSVSIKTDTVASLSAANQHPWIIAAVGTPGVNGEAIVLNSKDGSTVKKFGGHTDAIYAASLNHDDSRLATAGYDRRILIHDVATGKILQTLEGHNGAVFSVAFDPTGKVICSASADGTIKVWDVDTGQRLDTLSQPRAEQYSVLVSRDGKRIFGAGADNRIRVWRLVSRGKAKINPQLISRFAHEQPITRLAMSSDGRLLASTAEDGTIRTWTTSPFDHLQILAVQKSPVTSMAFVDNKRLFVTRSDGTSDILPLKSEDRNKPTPSNQPASLNSTAALPDEIHAVAEADSSNDQADVAQQIPLPATISGIIAPNGGNDRDTDCYGFTATAGQQLILEVNAARNKSPLDSKIEVLTPDGKPILRTRLQAVRDSYFTFRGKDSSTSDDYRVFNWQEMELNEYFYSDGEVNRLWLYPRGPDSGFKVYPGFGSRHTYFDTTATSHALQAPCFIVVPRDPDEDITANGLPVFPIYFENDDDGRRELGSDSRLMFTAPADGQYVVRITDARGFSGADFKYDLTVRSPKPAYTVSMSPKKISVSPLTGKEISFTAKRIDGYEGPIMIDANHLPDGFGFSGPLEIQQGQLKAFGTLFATSAAKEPSAEELAKVEFVAHTAGDSEIGETQQSVGKLEELKVLGEPKLRITVAESGGVAGNDTDSAADNIEPLVLQIHPGETIQATVKLDRVNHKGIISFGKDDSGRGLPHGLYVDNIGLNGLLLLEDQSEREFFVTAAKWVPPSRSKFYLKSNVDSVTTLPVIIEVLPASTPKNNNPVTAATQ